MPGRAGADAPRGPTLPIRSGALTRAAAYCLPVGTALGDVGWVFSLVVSVGPPV